MSWENEFRHRIRRFEASPSAKGKGLSVSIKIRVTSGCYHREHSPNAYRIIDEYFRSHPSTESFFQEHESGPELLVYLSLGAAGISLSASVINLVTAIIKARSEGIKRGDYPSAPLELIVLGFNKSGNLEEEKILKIDSNDNVTKELIGQSLNNSLSKMISKDTKKNKTQRVTKRKRRTPKA
jgi:hypothetical protein